MELEEIKKLKQQAEYQIADIIEKLEKDTGCYYKGLNTHEMEDKYGILRTVHIDLRIPN